MSWPPLAQSERTSLWRLMVVLLGTGVLAGSLPAARARPLTPTEMIAGALPAKKSLKSATKKEFLAAICGAVRKDHSAAAAIASAAIAARREYSGDIVGMILRCSGKIDCEFVGTIVGAAVSADANAATKIGDAAIARASSCAEAIQSAIHRPATNEGDATKGGSPGEESALASTRGGADERFDPHEPLSLVCEDGTERAIRESQRTEFLRAHPGSFVGPCAPSPTPTLPPAPKK